MNDINTNTTCPNCLSSLLINKKGYYECSGNNLHYWEEQFKLYDTMSSSEKAIYLDNMSDKSSFLELHLKWSFKDADGHRSNFNCGYSHRTYSPVNRLRTKMRDPVAVRAKEKKLNRKLTEEELKEIPIINFPDEV